MSVLDILFIVNLVITSLITFFFLYQIGLIFIGLFGKKKYPDAKEDHNYAILIAGRNEEKVIGHLIESIKLQDYDLSKLKVFVVADNCTDNTAKVAKEAGGEELFVHVFERHNLEKIGKGFALDFMFKNIRETFPDYIPDAFFVFDADNLLDKNYVKEMNKAFDSGAEVLTSYRNSKNFNANWIAASTAMCFLRECRFMHSPRSILNTSTFVSGTGFLVSSKVLNFEDGWKYKTMTEDIEFSAGTIAKGKKVMYCDDAIFYDEQPTTFKASWNQRMRWQKGFYQCFLGYFGSLFMSMFACNFFSKYEMMLMIFPFTPITFFWGFFYFMYQLAANIVTSVSIGFASSLLVFLVMNALILAICFMLLFFYALILLIRESKRVKTTYWEKIKFSAAFPIFLLTYIPIAIVCLFKKNVQWKKIPHEDSKKISEINN